MRFLTPGEEDADDEQAEIALLYMFDVRSACSTKEEDPAEIRSRFDSGVYRYQLRILPAPTRSSAQTN